ncbi:hypothetical protein CLIB1444_01S00804 [[Candida] jaroonii]|uniref:Uncharacterized protein n=1 Tax=[Candida] jaroonii TaxID=467808 RepID=A0ACA9Y049_9ASCO|nr:hypothetical protein CLIB1444_01S00804 [[Candida] jaroonii]
MSEQYYSTGRGGAGNIAKGSGSTSPKLVPQGSNTPHISSEKLTTGRGGFGNIIKNDDPELTRKLQDVDNGLRPVTSSKSYVGRGGYGNIIDENLAPRHSNKSNKAKSDSKAEKHGFFSKIGKLFK